MYTIREHAMTPTYFAPQDQGCANTEATVRYFRAVRDLHTKPWTADGRNGFGPVLATVISHESDRAAARGLCFTLHAGRVVGDPVHSTTTERTNSSAVVNVRL